MRYKTILVTGGAGFVGSNLAISFKSKYSKLNIIAFDNLKRHGAELNIARLKNDGIKFIHGDIRNPEDLDFKQKIDCLIECAGEPSVLSGYGESPAYMINTNLVGTINCLELARKNKADVIFFSTSRVYPYDTINSLEVEEQKTRFQWKETQDLVVPGWSKQGIDVEFSLTGVRSMYGATKLCSELLLQEYINMYDMRGVINRCGVIAGPWQFGKADQGVFSLWMLLHYFKKKLSYIGFGGRGKQVRDLLHIQDLFELIDRQINAMGDINGRIFNVGGSNEVSLSLLETTDLCRQITGAVIPIENDPRTRPADLKIYITDNRKINAALGWKPKRTAAEILEDIYCWIKENERHIQSLI